MKRQIEERKQETKAILENSSDLDQIAKDVFSRLVLANEQNQEEMSDLELVRHLYELQPFLESSLEGSHADMVRLAWQCERTKLFTSPSISSNTYLD